MPKFPLPTHTIQQVKGFDLSGIRDNRKLVPVSRYKGSGGWHKHAPMKAVTVEDAIGDLRPFDW
jgi:DNA (cytosine-5)-methyltransferase 1